MKHIGLMHHCPSERQLTLYVVHAVHSGSFRAFRLAKLEKVSATKEVFADSNEVLKVKIVLHKLVNRLKTCSSDYSKVGSINGRAVLW